MEPNKDLVNAALPTQIQNPSNTSSQPNNPKKLTILFVVFIILILVIMIGLFMSLVFHQKPEHDIQSVKTGINKSIKTISKPYLGIEYTNDSTLLNNHQGVFVSNVISKSPADIAGIKFGDIVTLIDDQPLNTSDKNVVSTIISTKKAGDTITITYVRLVPDVSRQKSKLQVDYFKEIVGTVSAKLSEFPMPNDYKYFSELDNIKNTFTGIEWQEANPTSDGFYITGKDKQQFLETGYALGSNYNFIAKLSQLLGKSGWEPNAINGDFERMIDGSKQSLSYQISFFDVTGKIIGFQNKDGGCPCTIFYKVLETFPIKNQPSPSPVILKPTLPIQDPNTKL